ncbi:MAG: cupredoxin domain-containing protein, partial [Firmicutes bacterium]|nr:cupredoxin domain-containing protein [Bacillota bacterium]
MRRSKSLKWLIPLVAAAILVGTGAAIQAAASVEPTTRDITIEAKRFNYSPGVITVNKGDLVRLHLLSTDVSHGFYLDGYELNVHLEKDQEKVVEFIADKPGRFSFRCSVTCGPFHPYMVGWLRIRP